MNKEEALCCSDISFPDCCEICHEINPNGSNNLFEFENEGINYCICCRKVWDLFKYLKDLKTNWTACIRVVDGEFLTEDNLYKGTIVGDKISYEKL